MIRFRIVLEPNGLYRSPSFEQRPAHAMHPIHDTTALRQNDGVGQVRLQDQLRVISDPPACRGISFRIERERLIQLSNLRQGDVDRLQVLRQLDQSIDIPCQESVSRSTEMILLPQPSLLRLLR